MFREVYIQRVDYSNEEPTQLLANAATPLRYKHVFEDDLLTEIANAHKTDENGREIYQIDFISELAFIMAMQANALSDKTIKLEKLNYEKYVDWLEQYDGMAFESAAGDIMNVYVGNAVSDSKSKKNTEGQSEN